MIPIRRLLLKDLLILTAAIIVVVCGMAWVSLSRVVMQEADEKAYLGLVRIEADLKDHFDRMEALGRSVEALWAAGTLDEARPEEADRVLFPFLKNTPQVASLAFWSTEGRGFLITPEEEPGRARNPRLSTQLWARQEGQVLGRWIRRTDQLLPTPEPWAPLGMEPALRPWYLNAVAKGRAGWVEPYPFWPDLAPGLSYAIPVRGAEGRLRGVLILDMYLEDLTAQVWKNQPTRGTQALIVDAGSRVLIPPRLPAFDTAAGRGKAFLAPLEHAGIPLGPELLGASAPAYMAFTLREGGHAFRALAAPFSSSEGIAWRVGVAVPLDEVGSAARTQMRRMLLVMALTLVAVVWRSRRLARRFGEPLADMAVAAQGLASGKVLTLPATGISELGALNEVLRTAAEAIHARSDLERKVEQSQRLETVGTLAGGIAHDVNNQLLAIQGQLDLARGDLGPAHVTSARLDRAEEAIQRCAQMIRGLLAFSHHAKPQVRPMLLNEVVQSTASLMERVLGGQVRVAVDLSPEDTTILGEPVQWEQVLLNLAVNARDAMPDGGTVRLATRVRPDGWIDLEVSDTGKGIPEADLPHVFEPFFTTKDVGKGTGLGLSMVFGIVKAHQGEITVTSQPGQGTAFHISLPGTLAFSTAERVRLLTPVAGAPPPGTRVLVVDDEPAIRDILAEALSQEGMVVIQAVDGDQGWEAFQREAFDLVVSDQRMPGCTGTELLARIRAGGSRVPFILSSGHGLEGLEATLAEDPNLRLLPKPFQLRTLFGLAAELTTD